MSSIPKTSSFFHFTSSEFSSLLSSETPFDMFSIAYLRISSFSIFISSGKDWLLLQVICPSWLFNCFIFLPILLDSVLMFFASGLTQE